LAWNAVDFLLEAVAALCVTEDDAWRRKMRFYLLLIAVLLFSGCQTKQQPSAKTTESETPLSAHGTSDTSQPPAKVAVLKGKVLERLSADRYSYLRLSTSSGEIWAAVLQTDVKEGEEVSVMNPMPMDGFESKTLNRKFDKIVFGTLDQQTQQENAMQTLSKAHANVSNTPNAGPIRVQKAAGAAGRTIAEIFEQRLQLKDKGVAVQGKVVKVNSNIMGKTWVHLQDGTGDPKSKTNDLTVTTQGSITVGDTILVNGIVRTDQSIGMGYVLPAMIENATVTK
jgi:hypothetical protein